MYLFGCCARRHNDVDREVSLLSPKIDNNEKQQTRRSRKPKQQPHYGLIGQGHPRPHEGQGQGQGQGQGDAQVVLRCCEGEMHCLAMILPDGTVEAAEPGAEQTAVSNASSSARLLDDEDSDGGGGGGGGMVEVDNPTGEEEGEEEEVCFSKSSEDSRWSTLCEASNGSSLRDANSGGGGVVLSLSADPGRRIVCDSPDTGISWSFPDITSSDDQGSSAAIVQLDSHQVHSSRTTSIGRSAVFIDANRPSLTTAHGDQFRFGHQRIADSFNSVSSGNAQQSKKTKDKDQEQFRHTVVIDDKALTRYKSFSNDVVKVTQYVIETIDRVCDSFVDGDQNNLDKKNSDFNENSEIPMQIDENKNESHDAGKDSIYFQGTAISGGETKELLTARCIREINVRENNNGDETKAAGQLKGSNDEFVWENSECEDEDEEVETQSVNSKEIYFRNTFELISEDDFLREEDFNYSTERYETNEYEPYESENRDLEADRCIDAENIDEYHFELSRSESVDFNLPLSHQQSENLEDMFESAADVFVREIFEESLEELMKSSISCSMEQEPFPEDIPPPLSDFFQHMELLSDDENEEGFELICKKTQLSASSPLHELDLILESENETICPPTRLLDIGTLPTGDEEPPVGDDSIPLMTNTSTDARSAFETVVVNERIFPEYKTEIQSNEVEIESGERQLEASTVAGTTNAATEANVVSTDSNEIKPKEEVHHILAFELDKKLASRVDPENTTDEGYLSYSCTDSCVLERSGSIEGTLSFSSSSESACNRSSLGPQQSQFDILDWKYDDRIKNPNFNSLNSVPSVDLDVGNGSVLTTSSVETGPMTASNELDSDRNAAETYTYALDSPAKDTIDRLSYGYCPEEDKAVFAYAMDSNESIAEKLSLIECLLPRNTANDSEHCCRLVTTHDVKDSNADQTMTDKASKEFMSLCSKGRDAIDETTSGESEKVDDRKIIDCDFVEQIRNASEQMNDIPEHVYQAVKQNHCSPEEIRHEPEQSRHEVEQIHHEAEQIHSEPERIHHEAEQIHHEPEQSHHEAEQIHSKPERIHHEAEQIHREAEQIHREPEQIHREPEQIHHEAEQIHNEAEQIHHEAEQIHHEQEQSHHDLKHIRNQLEHVVHASEQADDIQEIGSNLRRQDHDKLYQVYDFQELDSSMMKQSKSELDQYGDDSSQVDCPSEYLDVLPTPDDGVKDRVGDATELPLRVAEPSCDFPTQDTKLLKDNDDPIVFVKKFPEHVYLEPQLVNTISETTSEEIDEMLEQLCSSSERVLEHVASQPKQNADKLDHFIELPIQDSNLLEQTFEMPEQILDKPEQILDKPEQILDKPEQILDKPEQAFVIPQKVDDLLEKADDVFGRVADMPKGFPSLSNDQRQSVDEPITISGSPALKADFFSMYIIDLSKNEFQEQQREEITEKKKVGETGKKRFIVSSSKFELPSSRSPPPPLPADDSATILPSSMIHSDHLLSPDSCHDDDAIGGSDESPSPRPVNVRRSVSLKTSPTGTPRKKKAVRFADALGLELESIRHIRSSDEIPSIPNSAIPLDPFADDPGGRTVSSSSPRGYLGISFSQPGSLPDFLCRVFDQRVCLESCVPNDRDFIIKGCIRVFNMSYRKSVVVRYSTNSWSTFRDNSASYVMNSSDGTTDRFTFSVVLPSCFGVGNKLEFAICYRAGEDLSESFWDNNRNSNYVVECYSSGVEAAAAAGSDSPAWLHFL